MKPDDEIKETPEVPVIQAKTLKSKVFNVALDPITNDAPQFAQVLIPVSLNDDQKKRLISFIENPLTARHEHGYQGNSSRRISEREQ